MTLDAIVQEAWDEFCTLFPDWANDLSRPESTLGVGEHPKRLAALIDHTALGAEVNADTIARVCAEAREYGFASVCVNSAWVPLARQFLAQSPVKVCTVVGFPLGANLTVVKAFECAQAIARGADEIDMVLPIGSLKACDYQTVFDDVAAVVGAAQGRLVKVILETCLLDDRDKLFACWLSRLAGAHFVKTSTGFSKAGATVRDVELMRRAVGPTLGVKASGGIRDHAAAMAMIGAGASRLGCSASVAIAHGTAGGGDY